MMMKLLLKLGVIKERIYAIKNHEFPVFVGKIQPLFGCFGLEKWLFFNKKLDLSDVVHFISNILPS